MVCMKCGEPVVKMPSGEHWVHVDQPDGITHQVDPVSQSTYMFSRSIRKL